MSFSRRRGFKPLARRSGPAPRLRDMPVRPPFDPRPLQGSAAAVARARAPSLNWARRELARRAEIAAAAESERPAELFADAHSGLRHLEFFHGAFAPALAGLPAGFSALEVGAGMGWISALVAASGAGAVLSTEIGWRRGDRPAKLENAHTLWRLAEREPLLRGHLEFVMEPEIGPVTVRFPRGMAFAAADAGRLPVGDGSLDLLFSHNCLEHLPDLPGAFAEAARTLKTGGVFFADSYPLFFSAQGHHLWDLFPAPWAHLLWPIDELAELAVAEAGSGREWSAGVPLAPSHLTGHVFPDLNGASPADLRRALRTGPWKVRGWTDMASPEDDALAREMNLRAALPHVAMDALTLGGVMVHLERRPAPEGWRWPMRLGHRTRRWIKRWR